MAETKDKSLGELFGDLMRETSNLVRQEVQLAKTEMTQKAAIVGKSLGLAIAGALLGLGAFGAFVATMILLLVKFGLDAWLAALIVTAVLGGLAAMLALMGIGAIKKASLAPQQTIEALKEDVQWAKEQAK